MPRRSIPLHPWGAVRCLLYFCAFWGIGNVALSQPPGSSVAAQRAIEARLPPSASTGTRSDADVAAAVARAVVDFLEVKLPPDVAAADVVTEAVRARAGNLPAVERILSAVTEALLTLEPDAGVRAVLDESVAAASLALSPENVAELVRSQIGLLATSATAQSLLPKERPPDDLLPVEAFTERIIAGAVKALRKVPTARLGQHIQDIAAKALSVAPPSLYEEIAAASARTSSSGSVILAPLTGGASNLLRSLLNGVPETPEDVGAIVAGVLRGRGASVIAAVRVELASTRPAFTAYTDAVLEGFSRTAEDHGEYHITYLRQEGAKFDRAGLVTGAAARWPAEVQKFTQLALRDPGTNSTVEIARAAGRAVPLLAGPSAAWCATTRDVKPGELAQGFVEGAHSAVTGAIVARQLTAMGTVAGDSVRAVVAGAVSGAVATGKAFTLPTLAFEAARASRFPGDVAAQGIASAPRELRYVIALGALAADTAPPAELQAQIRTLLDADSAQRSAFDAGSAVILRVQENVRDFLPSTIDGLARAPSDIARIAVIHAATLVNPKGATAIAAAGVAHSDAKLRAEIAAAATQSSPAKAAGIQLASNTAAALKEGGADSLTSAVLRPLFLFPEYTSDIAAAAVIAAPQQAAEIARAASTRLGVQAARMVPALLAFSSSPAAGGETNARAERTRRIVAAVVAGLIEARLVDRETAAITSAVEAATLWACSTEATERDPSGGTRTVALLSAPQISLAADGLLESVIRSAVTASPRHGLAVARVTAETLATFTRGTFTDAEGQLSAIIRSAGALNFAAQLASATEVGDAIAFGITAHTATTAGATALDVINYSRSTGMGRPVSAFRDE